MSTINFSEVEDNQQERAPRKTVSPGIGVFTIDEAEIKANVNNNEYIAVKFTNPEGQYLKQQFYLTPKALVRLKELVVNSGLELVVNEQTEALCARLLGKKIGLKVDGEKVLADINGETVPVTRGQLGFRNYSYPADQESPFKDFEVVVTDKTGAAPAEVAPVKEDMNNLPF